MGSHGKRFVVQGYLPGQLYNLNSKFGNQEELKSLVSAFKEAGVRPVCEPTVLAHVTHVNWELWENPAGSTAAVFAYCAIFPLLCCRRHRHQPPLRGCAG